MQSSLGGLDLDGAWSKDEHRFRVRGRLTGPASDLLSQSGQVFVRYFSFGDASGGHQYRPPSYSHSHSLWLTMMNTFIKPQALIPKMKVDH